MERWTRMVIRYRWVAVAAWLLVLLGGGFASTRLAALLSNTFTMPGTDSERARTILKERYGDRSDGAFTVVFEVPDSHDPKLRLRLQRQLEGAARVVPSGHARPLVPGGDRILYGDIVSTLDLATAKGYTDDVLQRLGHGAVVGWYVNCKAGMHHYLDPIF